MSASMYESPRPLAPALQAKLRRIEIAVAKKQRIQRIRIALQNIVELRGPSASRRAARPARHCSRPPARLKLPAFKLGQAPLGLLLSTQCILGHRSQQDVTLGERAPLAPGLRPADLADERAQPGIDPGHGHVNDFRDVGRLADLVVPVAACAHRFVPSFSLLSAGRARYRRAVKFARHDYASSASRSGASG